MLISAYEPKIIDDIYHDTRNLLPIASKWFQPSLL